MQVWVTTVQRSNNKNQASLTIGSSALHSSICCYGSKRQHSKPSHEVSKNNHYQRFNHASLYVRVHVCKVRVYVLVVLWSQYLCSDPPQALKNNYTKGPKNRGHKDSHEDALLHMRLLYKSSELS